MRLLRALKMIIMYNMNFQVVVTRNVAFLKLVLSWNTFLVVYLLDLELYGTHWKMLHQSGLTVSKKLGF